MHQYKLISKVGEGTFSEVLKAQSLKTGNYCAIKCMKNHFTNIEQVNKLREIQALKKLSPHEHIVKLIEVLYDEPTGRLALVFELMELNMYELIKDRKKFLNQQKVRQHMYQVFKAIDHMHKKGIFHRDIKPENILLTSDTVKLADLGSCRGMFSEQPYTEYISTRWYRPPECLMTDGYYDHKMDIWGAGCVMFEILTLVPIFPGNDELDMIHRIHKIIGTPHPRVLERFKKHATHLEFNFPTQHGTGIEKMMQHCSKECIDVIRQTLIYDPEERPTAEHILKHEYFRDLYEADHYKDFQSSLTSIKLSPTSNKFQHQESGKSSRNLSSHIHPDEKAPYYQMKMKKKPKKLLKDKHAQKPLPSVKVNLKVEGIFKPSHYGDTSTEDEGERTYPKMGGSHLPSIKQQPFLHIDSKLHMNPYASSTTKKKDEYKKISYYGNVVKSGYPSNYLYKKPLKKPYLGGSYHAPNEYVIYGKKAN